MSNFFIRLVLVIEMVLYCCSYLCVEVILNLKGSGANLKKAIQHTNNHTDDFVMAGLLDYSLKMYSIILNSEAFLMLLIIILMRARD